MPLAVAPSAKLLRDAYTDWIGGFSVLDTEKSADPDLDGLTNEIEFALNTSPDSANSTAPLQLVDQATYWEARFTPECSLNLVSYAVEYTEDLALGFSDSMSLTAGMIDGSGLAVIPLPEADRLFIRLSVAVP